MANNSDWLPSREQDLVDLAQKWAAGLADSAKITAFGWKQAEAADALAKVSAFLTARAAYEDVDSTANRMAKDETKDAAKSAMREFANSSIRYNKQMTDEDKLVYGIRPHDHTATPAGEPASFPEAEPDTSIIRQVTINFWDSATKKRGKPHGVHGAEIRWALLDHTPESVEKLTNSDFDTASPLTLKFDESQRGQRVYFCLRWETNTNLKGPFGEIYSAVIP
ncbi:MAG: hypothetical protein LBD07_00935 [Spirochaetaceae bacterium]|jgi:hypothetical protein|nr:hypothetical protein [Spirochaetaceae bacterium]